jgi:mRNA interferase MazF
MKSAGQIALVPFPYTDLRAAKLRPVLLLCRTPGRHDDWLVCMVSSQLHQAEADFDELLLADAPDFPRSGLKAPSVFRLARLAILDAALFVGSVGCIDDARLVSIRHRLADWLTRESAA